MTALNTTGSTCSLASQVWATLRPCGHGLIDDLHGCQNQGTILLSPDGSFHIFPIDKWNYDTRTNGFWYPKIHLLPTNRSGHNFTAISFDNFTAVTLSDVQGINADKINIQNRFIDHQPQSEIEDHWFSRENGSGGAYRQTWTKHGTTWSQGIPKLIDSKKCQLLEQKQTHFPKENLFCWTAAGQGLLL